jgi:hypothetical protein
MNNQKQRADQSNVIILLAHSTLLPNNVSKPILAGNPPPLTVIVDALLIGSLDCYATVESDGSSTLNHRRIARACVIVAFLAALSAVDRNQSPSEAAS